LFIFTLLTLADNKSDFGAPFEFFTVVLTTPDSIDELRDLHHGIRLVREGAPT